MENKKQIKLEHCPECKEKLQVVKIKSYCYLDYRLCCFNSKCKFCGILRYIPEHQEGIE